MAGCALKAAFYLFIHYFIDYHLYGIWWFISYAELYLIVSRLKEEEGFRTW
jgi:hypothetical protein